MSVLKRLLYLFAPSFVASKFRLKSYLALRLNPELLATSQEMCITINIQGSFKNKNQT